jgi:hypothetical protein
LKTQEKRRSLLVFSFQFSARRWGEEEIVDRGWKKKRWGGVLKLESRDKMPESREEERDGEAPGGKCKTRRLEIVDCGWKNGKKRTYVNYGEGRGDGALRGRAWAD